MLDELAPDLKSNGRSVPCAALKSLLRETRCLNLPLSVGSARALLLAAYQVRFATLLLEALPTCPYPALSKQEWHPRLVPRMTGIALALLDFVRDDVESTFEPIPRLFHYIESLPFSLVQQMVEWAPPVVGAKPDAHGRFRITANVIPALMAHQVKPDVIVRIKRSESRAPPQRSIHELAWAVRSGFGPLVERNRELVVRASPSLEEAQLLSGFSRSQCAKLRQRGLIEI